MEIKNLKSFLRVAELGNFTKAADDLGYAQSTITLQIQQLEEELGMQLFDRIGKKVFLTPYGKMVVDYANQMVALEKQIIDITNDKDLSVNGILRIGIVESIMNSILLAIIGEYRNRFPNVFLQIVPAVSPRLLGMLQQNDVDIIYTMGTMVNSKECTLITSHNERAVFAVSPIHPLAGRAHISIDELLDYSILFNGDNTFLQQELYKLANKHGKTLSSNIQSESSTILMNLAINNLGILFGAEYLFREEPFKNKLIILNVDDFSLEFKVFMYKHKNKWMTPSMTGLQELTEAYWEKIDNENTK